MKLLDPALAVPQIFVDIVRAGRRTASAGRLAALLIFTWLPDLPRLKVPCFRPVFSGIAANSIQGLIEVSIKRLDNRAQIVTRITFQQSLPEQGIDFRFA